MWSSTILSEARLHHEDDPSRQLNVHGLTPEFPMATAGRKAEKKLLSIHCRLVRFGLLMGPGKIIGARPASRSVKNDQDATMRVTYDSHNTKKIVVKAANSAGLWGYREKNGKIAPFFRDVIDTGRKARAKSSQVKRKRKDCTGEGSQKNSKKPKTNITHVPETASENLESEEAQEEERQKEFVGKKMMKEKLQDENEKALKRQEQENEAEISDFLRAARNKSSHEEENATGQENADDTEEEEVELEYVQSHDEYQGNIKERENSPNLNEDESGGRICRRSRGHHQPIIQRNL